MEEDEVDEDEDEVVEELEDVSVDDSLVEELEDDSLVAYEAAAYQNNEPQETNKL